MPHLTLAFLGPVAVTLDGKTLNGFRYDKVRALLAYLAAESDRPHRRSALTGLLWPDLGEEAAHTNLRQVIAVLRGAIEDRNANPPFLLITRESLQWNSEADAEIDVSRFERLIHDSEVHVHRHPGHCMTCAAWLAEAAALYRGPFLAQFFLPDSAAFEEWAVLKREALQRQAIKAMARLVEHHERSGAYELAVHYAQQQLALEPWREESHRQVMRLLVLNNQRSAALVQYEQCRRALAEGLAAEPEAETTAMYEQIRDQAQDELVKPTLLRLPAEKPHNLPPQLTPFVGRERELVEISRLLNDPTCRLITLNGAGGIGKTRLALQAATELISAFDDGIYYVPLAPLNAPKNLSHVIAEAIGAPLTSDEDLTPQLIDFLHDKEMLLILDNFEHLLDGVGLLPELLAAAPNLTFLVTSTEPLRVAGEWLLEVGGLPFTHEDPAGSNPKDSVPDCEALKLFVTCARRVRSGFAAAPQEKRAIVRICQLLGGVPLAIELAAAWVNLLSCEEIALEIEADLDFLSTMQRDVPERQRSLRAVFDHAFHLLTPVQQSVFRRLSLFQGGFQRAAAEQVAGGTLLVLKTLLEKSLLQRSPSGLYSLHEYARQYAFQQLAASDDLLPTRARFIAYYLQLAETIRPTLESNTGVDGITQLEKENDNLRAAMQWSLEDGVVEQGLRLAISLYRFWYWHTHFSEGFNWLASFLRAIEAQNVPVPAESKAEACYKTGVLAAVRHEPDQSRGYLEKSLALYRSLGDAFGQAAALNSLGSIAFDEEDYLRAQSLYEESLKLKQQLGQQAAVAIQLNNLGSVAQALGDYPRAQALYEEALNLGRALQHQGDVAIYLGNLGLLWVASGDYEQARTAFNESLALRKSMGDQEGIAYCLEGLAAVAVSSGASGVKEAASSDASGGKSGNGQGVEALAQSRLSQAAQAAQLYGAAEALREVINISLIAIEKKQYEQSIQKARALLGEEAFQACWAEGRRMSLEKALEAAEAVAQMLPVKQPRPIKASLALQSPAAE